MAEVVAQRGEEEVGRDILLFHREDGVAENFRAEQNRELLETLSEQTGGRYYRPQDWAKLASEISYSEAGVTVRETKDLWDMPAVFLALIAIRSMEWLLRRRWGAV
jgi:DNA-binding transcriptional MerR regulator